MNIGHIKNNTTSLDGVMGPALGAIAAFAVCSTGGGVALLSFFPMLGFVCMMKGLWLLYGWRMSKSSNGFVNALVFLIGGCLALNVRSTLEMLTFTFDPAMLDVVRGVDWN